VAERGDLGSAGFARGAMSTSAPGPVTPSTSSPSWPDAHSSSAGSSSTWRRGRAVHPPTRHRRRALRGARTLGCHAGHVRGGHPRRADGGRRRRGHPRHCAAFDLVTVAQAFHWFDAPVALAEIARVLRPGGMLALIWNEREESDPVMAEFSRIISWDERRPLRDVAHYSPAIERTGALSRARAPSLRPYRTGQPPDPGGDGGVAQLRERHGERGASRGARADRRAGRLARRAHRHPYVTEVYTARVLARP